MVKETRSIAELCSNWWQKYTLMKKSENTAISRYLTSNRRIDRDAAIKRRVKHMLMEEFLLDLQQTFSFNFPKRF